MKSDIQGKPESLNTLLDLDGEIFIMDGGYWVKIEAKRVPPSPSIPHGIRYLLTLHDRNNPRVLGYDNAHAVKLKSRKRFSGRKITLDHKHHMERIGSYEFESAGEILDDFWTAVNKEVGV